jgi:hypothetical protein
VRLLMTACYFPVLEQRIDEAGRDRHPHQHLDTDDVAVGIAERPAAPRRSGAGDVRQMSTLVAGNFRRAPDAPTSSCPPSRRTCDAARASKCAVQSVADR